jgi:hypothetical protein
MNSVAAHPEVAAPTGRSRASRSSATSASSGSARSSSCRYTSSPKTKLLLKRRLRNYCGYNPFGFFAPELRYRAGSTIAAEPSQFKQTVRALHAEGIEVVLDVVYNHTAEGNHRGPTLNLKGIDNTTYYRFRPSGSLTRSVAAWEDREPSVRNRLGEPVDYKLVPTARWLTEATSAAYAVLDELALERPENPTWLARRLERR